MNWKKELGMCLQEIKSSEWFKELSTDLQEIVLSDTKEIYSPPDKIQNTLINMSLKYSGYWDKWVKNCYDNFPWADPIKGNAEVNIHKRNFNSKAIAGIL